MSTRRVVRRVTVRTLSVRCPHCGHNHTGLMSVMRGASYACSRCRRTFTVR